MSNQYTMSPYTNKEINDILQSYQNGMSYSCIALKFKRKKPNIKNILIENKIWVEGRNKLKKEFSNEIIEEIIKKYKNGLSCQKISEMCNVSKTPIKRIIKEKNLLREGYSDGTKIELTEKQKGHIKKLYLDEYKNSNEIGEILNLNKHFVDAHIHKNGYRRNRSNGTSVGMVKKYRGSSYSYLEYLNDLNEFYKYKINVNRITKQQSIENLLNYNKRGKSGVCGAYQLDHKFSIMEGFKNKISPSIIGNINNLEFIPWIDNIKKRAHCSITKEELIIK